MVENFKGIESSRLYKEGLFTVQDISSMLVAKVVAPKEGDMVLDMCSAPGGKSTHMAELMKNTGKIVSRDVFEHKIKVIKAAAKRLGIKNIEAEEFDAANLDENSIEKFDCVLTDVPCSGLGIIRRKPEIKYKAKEELVDLPKIQSKILENASKYVKINGTLVYSTCTVQDCENIEVVEKFLKENPNYELVPIEGINVDPDEQEKGYIKIYPNVHGMDGFFIAKMKRVK